MHHLWWWALLLLCGATSLDDRQQFGKFLQQLKRKPMHGEGGIPRLLFTSHRTPRAELPPKLRENVDAWRRLNPSFAFRYFDDAAQSKFMRETCAVPRCLEAYDVLVSGAGKADLFRIAYLYYVGGWWVDADLKPGPIAENCDLAYPEKLLLVAERHGMPRFMILAGNGHPLLAKTLATQISNVFRNHGRSPENRRNTLFVTGPSTLARTICHELGADLGSPHCGRGRFVGFAGATKLAPFAARAFAGGFRMDTCSEFWFSPFPDFDHKRELRSMNLTHYSLLRTAR